MSSSGGTLASMSLRNSRNSWCRWRGRHLVSTCPEAISESGKQGSGAVADIIMGHTLHISQTQGQDRLGAVHGLNLALLLHTQDHGLSRRVEIEPDDTPHFLHKEGVGGKLEMFLPVRLQAESPPDAMYCGSGNFCLGRQRPHGPMGGGLRLCFS